MKELSCKQSCTQDSVRRRRTAAVPLLHEYYGKEKQKEEEEEDLGGGSLPMSVGRKKDFFRIAPWHLIVTPACSHCTARAHHTYYYLVYYIHPPPLDVTPLLSCLREGEFRQATLDGPEVKGNDKRGKGTEECYCLFEKSDLFVHRKLQTVALSEKNQCFSFSIPKKKERKRSS